MQTVIREPLARELHAPGHPALVEVLAPKGRFSEKTRQRALHDIEIGRQKARAKRRKRSSLHHA